MTTLRMVKRRGTYVSPATARRWARQRFFRKWNARIERLGAKPAVSLSFGAFAGALIMFPVAQLFGMV